jgi:hypothetical protein
VHRMDASSPQPPEPFLQRLEKARNPYKRARPSPNPKNVARPFFGIAGIGRRFFSSKI